MKRKRQWKMPEHMCAAAAAVLLLFATCKRNLTGSVVRPGIVIRPSTV